MPHLGLRAWGGWELSVQRDWSLVTSVGSAAGAEPPLPVPRQVGKTRDSPEASGRIAGD